MANYRAHTVFNFCLGLPASVAALNYLVTPTLESLTIFVSMFCYGTLFMSPDVDQADKFKLLSLRGFLAFPFVSYALVFKHRGLSHSFILGTLSRAIWLFLWFLLLFFFIYRYLPGPDNLLGTLYHFRTECTYGFLGLFFADFCHLFIDFFVK
ncbi:MAG: hypothetical protein GWP59_06830 [Chlamydiales bacterium]|nr:DUF2227 family putative metal-binding protein [Chlamydiales bacterium]NCF71397.1 hypothetical protein [Chlamydiales bacterium]